MRVAIVNTYDARNVTKWSGIPTHLCKMFENMLGKENVEYIVLGLKRTPLSYLRGFYLNRVIRKNYLSFADESVLFSNKSKFANRFPHDLIITFEFFLVPLLKKDANKVVFWNDATFKNLHNFYGYASNLAKFSSSHGHRIQKSALDNSDYIVFSSEWAIESAVFDYNVDKRKIKKIAFASNLTSNPDHTEVGSVIDSRDKKVVKLLFLAVDWDRKGGDDAVTVTDNLNKIGVETVLYVVGTDVPERHCTNEKVKSFGFINKHSADGEAKIIDFLKQSTFLILPTRADCTPVAFSEANSYGLPVITTNVGGIPSLIVNNKNGFRFDIKSFVENATDIIVRNLPNSKNYRDVCVSSHEYYSKELSWDIVKKKTIEVFRELYPTFG